MIAEKSIIIFKGDVLPTSVRRGIHASFFLDTQKPFPYTPRVENQYLTGTILHDRRQRW
jgi:hypothetical protein